MQWRSAFALEAERACWRATLLRWRRILRSGLMGGVVREGGRWSVCARGRREGLRLGLPVRDRRRALRRLGLFRLRRGVGVVENRREVHVARRVQQCIIVWIRLLCSCLPSREGVKLRDAPRVFQCIQRVRWKRCSLRRGRERTGVRVRVGVGLALVGWDGMGCGCRELSCPAQARDRPAPADARGRQWLLQCKDARRHGNSNNSGGRRECDWVKANVR